MKRNVTRNLEGQEVAACGHDASKDLGSPHSGDGSQERRRQMTAAAVKKSTTSLSLIMEAYGLKQRRNFPQWPLRFGRKEFGEEDGITNKKKRG